MKNNKVKFNICNCHYALQKAQENGEMAFENPVAMPGAVSLSLDPNGEPESFYADGIEYYIIANKTAITSSLNRKENRDDSKRIKTGTHNSGESRIDGKGTPQNPF